MNLKNNHDDFLIRLREYMQNSLNCADVDGMIYVLLSSSSGMLELIDKQIEQKIKNLTELDSKNFADNKDQEIKMLENLLYNRNIVFNNVKNLKSNMNRLFNS